MAPQVLWLQTLGSMGWEEKCGKFRGREVQEPPDSGNTNVFEQMEPVCVGIFIHGDKVHLKILELSTEFYRHEYWSGLPFPSSGDLPDPGIKPASPALQEDYLPLSHQRSPNTNGNHQKDNK